MLEAWALLNQLRAVGIVVSREGDDLSLTPRHRLTDDLRAVIRQRKADLLECLRLEEPAPAYTPEEQAAYNAMRRKMAELLTDVELLAWIRTMGAEPYVGDEGTLRIRHGASVELPIREVVRERQDGLLALLRARGPPRSW